MTPPRTLVEVPEGIDGAPDALPLCESAASRQGRLRRLARHLWAAGGFVTFGLAVLGAVLPVLPTTPFMLLAAFCFARSSERLDGWFRSTKLYRTVFESYVEKRSMSVRAKLSVILPSTALLAVSAFFMRDVAPMLVVLGAIWVGHIVYFGLVVKTERA